MSTAYLVLSLIVAPLVGGGAVYYIQSRIRRNEAREMASIQTEASAASTPYQLLQNQLATKDAMLSQSQAQHHQFVESQMARNDATTQAILGLAEQVRVQTGNLQDLSSVLQTHRDEGAMRSGKIYEKIGQVNERLAGIESGIKNSIETAQDAAKTAKAAAEIVERRSANP